MATDRKSYEKYCRNFNEIHRRNEEDILVSVDGTGISKIYDCFGHVDANDDIVYDLEIVTKGGNYYHLWNVADSRLVFKRKGESL